MGCCGLRPPREAEADVYEIGFQLRRCHWGMGFAREAAVAVIAHAFDVLGARALIAGHHPDNGASRHLLGTLGFRYTHDEFYEPTQLMEPCYRLKRRLIASIFLPTAPSTDGSLPTTSRHRR